MNFDKMVQDLEEQSDQVKEVIFEDFCTFVTLYMWKEWVDQSINSQETASRFISAWKNKVLEQQKERIESYKDKLDKSSDLTNLLMQEVMPSPEEVDAAFQESLNEVIIQIKEIAKAKPYEE